MWQREEVQALLRRHRALTGAPASGPSVPTLPALSPQLDSAAAGLWRSHFMHYNFVKIHSTMRTTPAQTAVTHRLWEGEDLVTLLD